MTEGRVLADRYELRHPLGRGGMAEVWAAQDRTLGREVAVKILLDRFRDDAGFVQRFHDEARHVAGLNHPNLVAVYDTGTAQPPPGEPAEGPGQPFIVMELVTGRSMQDAIAAGGLTEDRALEVCADVCSALAYAHSRGLVHRDVKPGNILLAEDGTVKVTDFGIARAIDSETVTRTAAVLGTAAYLSPEQAQGLEIDERSDLYSLGIVLYEALTGSQPFQGDSAVTVAYQHVQEPPRPPREIDPDISPGAEAVTMRALAKNPANRYPSADEMRADLLHAQAGQEVAAPAVLPADETALLDPTTATRPVRSHEEETRRRRGVYVLLTVLALLALIAGVWYLAGVLAGDDGPRISVQDVLGFTVEQAEGILESQGLELGEVTEEPHDEVEAGRIFRQDPGEGEMVEEGSAVDVWVSTGPETATVPDLTGLEEEEALGLLRDAGLRAGDRSREASDEFPEGQIISHTPAPGEEVPADTAVDFVVSTGEDTVAVPLVLNRTEGEAIFRIEAEDLQVQLEYEHHDSVPEGRVIRQDPTQGTQVARGDIVTIWVSLGPEEVEEEEEEEPPPPPVEEEPPPPDDEDDEDDEDEDGEDDEVSIAPAPEVDVEQAGNRRGPPTRDT